MAVFTCNNLRFYVKTGLRNGGAVERIIQLDKLLAVKSGKKQRNKELKNRQHVLHAISEL